MADKPELLQMVITVLEVRPVPFFRAKGSENGMNMNRIRLFMEMIDKAKDLFQQSCLRIGQCGEPAGREIFAKKWIFVIMRQRPGVIEDSLDPFDEIFRSTAGKFESAGRAFESPDKMLDHMLRRHFAPEGMSMLGQIGHAIGNMQIEECFSKFFVIDVKGNGCHGEMISFLSALVFSMQKRCFSGRVLKFILKSLPAGMVMNFCDLF